MIHVLNTVLIVLLQLGALTVPLIIYKMESVNQLVVMVPMEKTQQTNVKAAQGIVVVVKVAQLIVFTALIKLNMLRTVFV